MPLPVITDTLRVAIRGTTTIGTRWENVLHFRKTGALTYAGAIVILDPLLRRLYNGATFGGGGLPWNNNAATTWTTNDYVYTPLDGISASTVINHADPGTSAAEALPAGAAIVFTLRTAKRGRSYRGRCYWGGMSETVSAAGAQPAAAVITGFVAQWNGLIAALVGTGVSLVVASYRHSTADDVTTVTSFGIWDSQRRRNH